MAETKTRATAASVDDFIAAAEPPQRSEDAKIVDAMLRRVTGETPKMWGPTIVGYGQYHYRYDSGHEGDMCRLGFSPRKTQLVLYVLTGAEGEDALLAKLGKHSTGKSCLYIKKLADVDMGLLEEIARRSLACMKEKYPI
ncbi:DUF1801 domain-containing protein [Sphingoaurantiacus capsulatus]|uniref:DUF1801 domain-containing protein n=1 Tax=Sphingoaurantiacus capsulatus TaxID=1771310 RepID=A0ABV7XFF6_9SPHN